MTISMYQAAIPPMVRALNNLAAILEKGEASAIARKIDPSVLIASRLYPDMLPLVKQIQIASDIARRGAARLAGVEAPSMEDSETSFPELIARLKATVAYLETLTPAQIDGTESKAIVLPMGKITMNFEGLPYLVGFVLPNVYFHITTAYNILRHNGVEVGKQDFLGQP
jgi:uncharacterized protein